MINFQRALERKLDQRKCAMSQYKIGKDTIENDGIENKILQQDRTLET